jgi:hypothetical protein
VHQKVHLAPELGRHRRDHVGRVLVGDVERERHRHGAGLVSHGRSCFLERRFAPGDHHHARPPSSELE